MTNLITRLRKLQIALSLEEGNLKINAPEGVVNQAIISEIKEHKEELIEYLNKVQNSKRYSVIKTAEKKAYYSLSSAQKRMYFLNTFEPDSKVYNMPQILTISGDLDIERLSKSFEKLIARHESLRTSFVERNGEPVQIINEKVDFSIVPLKSNTENEAQIITDFVQPFNLSDSSLLRVGLLTDGRNRSVLLVDMHHIITDGVSQNVLINEFISFYQNEEPSALRIQYKDYAEWQNGTEATENLQQQKEFWLKEYQEEHTTPELPLDFKRPAANNFTAGQSVFTLNAAETNQLKALAQQQNATLYMLMFAISNVWLSKVCNQQDIVLGTPVAGRQHADFENIIGMFVNTLPVRNQINGEDNFSSFLDTIKEKTLACFNNQAYPFETLINDLKLSGNMNRHPLFDVLFVYQNEDDSQLTLPGLDISPEVFKHENARFDLTWIIAEKNGQLEITLEYAKELFRADSAENFTAHFNKIVRSIIADPSVAIKNIDMLSHAEKKQLLFEFNNTEAVYPKQETIISLFEKNVKKFPANTALVFEDQYITYKELDEKANALAETILSTSNFQSGKNIGLFFDPSLETVVSVLAILKAGCAFVPLATDVPAERNKYIISDCGADILLIGNNYYHENFVSDLGVKTENAIPVTYQEIVATEIKVIANFTSEDLVYVIYTSGTTGKPKGVEIQHQGLVNYITWRIKNNDFQPSDTMLQLVLYQFDGYVANLFSCLVSGASIVIIPELFRLDTRHIAEVIIRENVSTISFPPGLFDPILNEFEKRNEFKPAIKNITLAGEKALDSLLEKSTRILPDVILLNEYGPTESTIGCTFNKGLNAANNKVIGRPVNNTGIYIVDAYNRLVPAGVNGEICIISDGLARGYVNNPELTASVFVNAPFLPSKTMYKTGDVGRWLPDGTVEIQGRKDDQVKIRGFRVEISEIESKLNAHEAVTKCVVIAKELEDGAKILIGYYEGQNEEAITLRSHLLAQLPDYMVPSFFMNVEKIPYTNNGKVDKKALPMPVVSGTGNDNQQTNEKEDLMIKIWSQVLGIENIGLTDNFFILGGDSIKSIQICSKAREAGYEITVKELFNHQTVKEQAEILRAIETSSEQVAIAGEVLLTPIQKWLLKGELNDKHHFNQSVLLHFNKTVKQSDIQEVFIELVKHHDALRIVLNEENSYNHGIEFQVSVEEHTKLEETERKEITDGLQASFDLVNGPLLKVAVFHSDEASDVLVIAHHLVMDGISWRILFEDLETLLAQRTNDEELVLPLKTDSYQSWSNGLIEYVTTETYRKAARYWSEKESITVDQLPQDFNNGENSLANSESLSFELTKEQTNQLLTKAHIPYNTQINDLLIAGLQLAINKNFGNKSIKLDLEGHGREDIGQDLNVNRTIGWFTSIYPIVLHKDLTSLDQIIKSVKEEIHQIPNNGIDYLLHKFEKSINTNSQKAAVSFNYLGQFDTDTKGKQFTFSNAYKGHDVALFETRMYELMITCIVNEGKLTVEINYSKGSYSEKTIQKLMKSYQTGLTDLISYCVSRKEQTFTPSDFTYKGLTIKQLEELQYKVDFEDVFTLSPMQEGMLFHSLMEPGSNQYFGQMSYHLSGNISIKAVRSSLNDLIKTFPVLRTAYFNDLNDRSLQAVMKEREIDFDFSDIRNSGENSAEQIAQFKEIDKLRGFNLNSDCLLRVKVIQFTDTDFEFIWSHHHIIMDGWCMGIVIQKFKESYKAHQNGEAVNIVPATPYSEYINWLDKQDQQSSMEYWRNYLSGYETQTSIKELGKTEHTEKTFDLVSDPLWIDEPKTRQLQELGKKHGVTINTILQVAWGILLSKYNNVSDVVFGTVVSGRPAEITGIDQMMGLFINAVPVRVSYEPDDTLADLLQKIQQNELDGLNFHYSPLADIQTNTDLGRELIDHMVIFEDYPIATQLESNAETEESFHVNNVSVFEQTNYDLTLNIAPGSRIQIKVDFNANAYSKTLITNLKNHFSNVIDQLVHREEKVISDILLITKEEEDQVLYDFNNTQTPLNQDKCFTDLFLDQVAKTPDNVVATHHDEEITYSELAEESKKIGSLLLKAQVKPNERVAIYMPRSINMLKSIVGVYQAGAGYVPVDTEFPVNRIKEILSDSSTKVILTDSASAEIIMELKPQLPDLKELILVDQSLSGVEVMDFSSVSRTKDDLAYIIYTSGTTGKPKGVMVHQLGMVNHLFSKINGLSITDKDVIIQSASPCFDISVWQFLAAPVSGGKLHIIDKEDVIAMTSLVKELDKSGATIFESVPSLMTSFLDELPDGLVPALGKLRWMVPTGEALSVALVKKWYGYYPDIKLLNAYGPTEASDDVTVHEVGYPMKGDSAIPIGKPIQNIHIYILDKDMNLCPVGVQGEICVAGLGVGKGYWNNQEKTNAAFVDNPFTDRIKESGYDTIYKTGDIGFFTEDGVLNYLGRVDEQVKIRGFRIELNEINTQLSNHPAIEEAIVVTKGDQKEKFLVAYYIAETEIAINELTEHLSKFLPDYMIPAYFIPLKSFPVSMNGKLDKKALPEPTIQRNIDAKPAENEIEEKLIEIWSKLLNTDKMLISTDGNFFEMGGHSLKANGMSNKILQEFEVRIPLKTIFEKPTITELADYIMTIKPIADQNQNENDIIELTL